MIPNTKTKIPWNFFVTSCDIEGINMIEIIRGYSALQPKNSKHTRFFSGVLTEIENV